MTHPWNKKRPSQEAQGSFPIVPLAWSFHFTSIFNYTLFLLLPIPHPPPSKLDWDCNWTNQQSEMINYDVLWTCTSRHHQHHRSPSLTLKFNKWISQSRPRLYLLCYGCVLQHLHTTWEFGDQSYSVNIVAHTQHSKCPKWQCFTVQPQLGSRNAALYWEMCLFLKG